MPYVFLASRQFSNVVRLPNLVHEWALLFSGFSCGEKNPPLPDLVVSTCPLIRRYSPLEASPVFVV